MKKVLLGATHSVIEPLGLLHLSTIARQEGYTPKIALAKEDFKEFDRTVKEFKPDILGFTVYTGNHRQVFSYLDSLKKSYPKLKIAIGGPHPTYFPKESLRHADYVVLSEGLNSFRRILRDEAEPGIVHLIQREQFPISDRRDFYKENKSHGKSPIKSVIAETGCPFSCTYCYNSSTLDSIEDALTPQQKNSMSNVIGSSKRLFPKFSRSVDDIIAEIETIKKVSPETKMIYFQDDVFGANRDWIWEFAKKYSKVGMPFHAQMRFENADPENPVSKERAYLLKEAGCTGLTFAIEAADPVIRKEVLNRNMKEDLMFNVLTNLNKLGYKVRTEQMLGLPYGATNQKTKINLDADIEILELNVRLKRETGLPTMAWASIFAPYRKTKIGDYCQKYGFYSGGNNDVPETFFQRSVLNFPKEWTGPSLKAEKKEYWLPKNELEDYKDNLQMLRDLFSFFAHMPEGDKLASKFLSLPKKEKSFFNLSTSMRRHLYDEVLYKLK
jgi:radical SAM superfamily enzyme YgiQ (UPF0313 family)